MSQKEIPDNSSILNSLEIIAQDLAEKEGCFLYDIDLVNSGHGRVLRIYIDKKDELISINDCSAISRGLNLILDEDKIIIPGGAYTLEVSSPGLERHLRKAWHFEKAVGKDIWFKTKKSFQAYGVQNAQYQKSKQITISLKEAYSDGFKLQLDEAEDVTIPYSEIEKAHVVFDFGKGSSNIKNNQKKASPKEKREKSKHNGSKG